MGEVAVVDGGAFAALIGYENVGSRTASRSVAALEHALAHGTATVDRNPAVTYLARLAPGSRRAQRAALECIAAILTGGRVDALAVPWHELRGQHTAAIRSALAERYAAATANRHLAALRGVLRESWRLWDMTAEDYHRAVDVAAVRGSRVVAGRALTVGELSALAAVCHADERPQGARDGAMLAVMVAAGLRRSEVAGLRLGDVDRETGRLVVAGKGNKQRHAFLKNGGARAMDAWLAIRGPEPGALFVPCRKDGRVADGMPHLSDQAVLAAMSRRAEQAHVPPFSPHDLRRTFVGSMLDAGADIALVQALVGHSSPQTTARYDRRPERAREQAAELVGWFPW